MIQTVTQSGCVLAILLVLAIGVRADEPAEKPNTYAVAFDALWVEMDAKYSYFSLKPDVDWNQIRETYRPRCAAAKSDAEFVETLRECLSSLKDMHVWIKTSSGRVSTHSVPWRRNWNSTVIAHDLTQVVECGKFAIVGRTRTDGFGCVLIVEQSEATEENVKLTVKAIERIADAPAFIVDLRSGCSGGDELLSRRIASAFNEKERVYAANRYRVRMKGHALGPIISRALPAGKHPITRPVACLVGHKCMSSGEALVLMFDSLPHATTIGVRTRGSSGKPRVFALPGLDIKVGFSSWFALTPPPDHKPFEGVGIEPNIEVNAPAQAYEKSDPTWQKGLAHLREQLK
ncbi:MAG: S41 family peptidase [Planctomycetes bacterium]|nr:S41 family peptidase [Planctomycetota bacterium]